MTRQEKDKTYSSDKRREDPRNFLFQKIYWFYIAIFLMMILFQFVAYQKPKEISWTDFEQTMLQSGDVEKLLVVNKEFVEVFIKSEQLQKEQHQEIKKNNGVLFHLKYLIIFLL